MNKESSRQDWRDQLVLSGSDLTDEQRAALTSLPARYEDMLDGRRGFTSLVQHHIDTGDAPPVRSAPRRVPPFLQDKVKAELDRMVGVGILEENFGSGWGSPICVVTKKDGSVRICADLRKVNALTRITAYSFGLIPSTTRSRVIPCFVSLTLNSVITELGLLLRIVTKLPLSHHLAPISKSGCHSASMVRR